MQVIAYTSGSSCKMQCSTASHYRQPRRLVLGHAGLHPETHSCSAIDVCQFREAFGAQLQPRAPSHCRAVRADPASCALARSLSHANHHFRGIASTYQQVRYISGPRSPWTRGVDSFSLVRSGQGRSSRFDSGCHARGGRLRCSCTASARKPEVPAGRNFRRSRRQDREGGVHDDGSCSYRCKP